MKFRVFNSRFAPAAAGFTLAVSLDWPITSPKEEKRRFPKRDSACFYYIFFLIWAGDGVNSFITDFLNKTILYETTNTTRLITGFGMGLVMSTALMTLFNLTVWQDGKNQPLLHSLLQVAAYMVASDIYCLDPFVIECHLFSILCVYQYSDSDGYHHIALFNFLDNIIKEGKQFHKMEFIGTFSNCRFRHCNPAGYIIDHAQAVGDRINSFLEK